MTTTTHQSTVTAIGDPGLFGSGPHRIDCTTCGHVATFAGREFTRIEAMRHDRFMNGRR